MIDVRYEEAGNTGMVTRRQVAVGLAFAAPLAGLPFPAGAKILQNGSRHEMNEQDIIAIVERQHALVSAGRIEDAAAMFSDPTRNHGRVVPRGRILTVLGDIRTTFPDLTFPIEEVVASGRNVVVRCRFKGTHLGVGKLPVNGGLMIDVAPTGRHMDVQHIHWYGIENGLIAEHWASRDDVGMMQQLGLLPATKFDSGQPAEVPGGAARE